MRAIFKFKIRMIENNVIKRKTLSDVPRQALKRIKYKALPNTNDLDDGDTLFSTILCIPDIMRIIWSYIQPPYCGYPDIPSEIISGIIKWIHYQRDSFPISSMGHVMRICNKKLNGMIAPLYMIDASVYIDDDMSFLGQYCTHGVFPEIKLLAFIDQRMLDGVAMNRFPNLEYIHFSTIHNKAFPRTSGEAFDKIGFFAACLTKLIRSTKKPLTIWYPSNKCNDAVFVSVERTIRANCSKKWFIRAHGVHGVLTGTDVMIK